MDQVAYIKPGTKASIGVLTDKGGVDPALTDFLKLVIGEYADVPVAETTCGCEFEPTWGHSFTLLQ